MKAGLHCIALAGCFALLLSFESWAAVPALALKPISLGSLIAPVNITNAGDGSMRLFICDEVGQIRIVSDEMLLPKPFLDLSAKLVPLNAAYDERGLLGLAFHPGFANASSPGYRKFYVFYSAPSSNAPGTTTSPVNCRSTISEFQVSTSDPNVADPTTERVVLAFDKPQLNHNGGQLAFGPDGYLYIGVGDGGSQHDNDYGHTGGQSGDPVASGNLGNAQDTTKLLGKILRIDPLGNNGPGGSYGIPATNPFTGAGGAVRPEIYSFGMRNPWRFSFDNDPVAGSRLIEGDVGQNDVEEINLIVAGGNYGWRIKEGTFFHDSTAPSGGGNLIDPVAEYAHPATNDGLPKIGSAVIGGYVYRGSAIPGLVGEYLFADYNTSLNSTPAGVLLALDSGSWALSKPAVVGVTPFYIMAMGQGENGELYVAAESTKGPQVSPTTGLATGGIYQVVAAQVATVTITPAMDNTMFSESSAKSDALGNIYSGETAQGAFRRGLLAFSISSQVPAGALVTGAQLGLNLNFTSASSPANMSLYRLIQSWGEGSSDPGGTGGGSGSPATAGDATWADRFYDPSTPSLWTKAGGTYVATASATASVGTASGYYSWSSAQMATDVQGWLNNAASNDGWILIGDETTQSARRFDSRESPAGVQPMLQISYAMAPPLTWRETWVRKYFSPVGAYVSDTGDPNGDGLSNLVEYAASFSPTAVNPPAAASQSSVSSDGVNDTFTILFRRDPRAVDLTYQLQTSSDLKTWTTVVQSNAGAAPAGSAFVSEADAPGESPVKVVTAVQTFKSPANCFSRLLITRAHQ